MRYLIRGWMLIWSVPYVVAWWLMFAIACIGFGPLALVHLLQGGPTLWNAWNDRMWR